ncbi:MAG: 3-phosphoserine/phosphohydroxythreonine transaminase [Bacteroidota bacterium]
MKKHNFSSGPAMLPKVVFEKAAAATINLDNSGLSILEISHRSSAFQEILGKTEALIRQMLDIPESYAVLFLTGGASSQFYMAPMNLLPKEQKAGFIDTGRWSDKAIKEAKQFGEISVIASSEDRDYTYIPKSYSIESNLTYLHVTSNNTIYGTQYKQLPQTTVPLVCDMSSDIFSYPVDIHRFGLIYAGAQKNLGPAGVTLVIVKKEMLEQTQRLIPTMLDYRTHIAKGSAFNTPPVFPIFVSMLTLEWLEGKGGIKAMQEKNEAKAKLFYDELDRNGLLKGVVATEDRSVMNATFVTVNKDLENAFLELCTQADISGIKGHRTVGGFRASMYNAMEMESVQLLIEVMQYFEKKYG